ncbi:unnamed protein product, partial [Tetraodon nigroviridis]
MRSLAIASVLLCNLGCVLAGLLKTHNLSFQDSESLQAVFDKDSCGNVFRCNPRVLVDTVMHFPPSLEEVTVSVTDERMWVRNHVEEHDQGKAMLTELCLGPDEFDQFAVQNHKSITFCLKELRGLLVFAESTSLPVSMHFDEPGSPVVFSVTDSVLEGNFVLATLSDDISHHRSNTTRANPSPPAPDDFLNDDMDSYLIAMDTSIAPGPSSAGPSTPQFVPTVCSKQPAAANHGTGLYDEEEDEEETDTPEPPPNKKFCSLFFGSVLPPSSQVSTQPVTTQEVLASDSEDDGE